MKDISRRMRPAPSQVGHLPPAVLNENREAVCPRMRDSGSEAKWARMRSKMPR